MAIKIKASKARGLEIPPPGLHRAVCFTVVDLGTQNTKFGPKHQGYIAWELPQTLNSQKQPFTVGKFYSLIDAPGSTLRKDLEAWYGRTFADGAIANLDLVAELIGRPGVVNITHKPNAQGQMRSNVVALAPARKDTRQTTDAETLVFGFDGEFDWTTFDKIPEFLRNRIIESPEYQEATAVPFPPSPEPARDHPEQLTTSGATRAAQLRQHFPGKAKEAEPEEEDIPEEDEEAEQQAAAPKNPPARPPAPPKPAPSKKADPDDDDTPW
jgi:hypothetical protein